MQSKQLKQRSRFGQVGKELKVVANTYTLNWDTSKTLQRVVYHYDAIQPPAGQEDKNISAKKGRELMDRLQREHPEIFTPRVPYDGKKNMWSARPLELQSGNRFIVTWAQQYPDTRGPQGQVRERRPPKTVEITIVLVDTVDTTSVIPLLNGAQATPQALTTINALNVLLNAAPNTAWRRAKAYYVEPGMQQHGPFEFRRGFFQSVRPSLRGLVVNVDLTTGVMLHSTNLVDFCMSFLKLRELRDLARLSDFQFTKLRHFLRDVKVSITLRDVANGFSKPRKIAQLLKAAGRHTFTNSEGEGVTVQQHFIKTYAMSFNPDMIGVRIGEKGVYPLMVCKVAPGQLYNRRMVEDWQKELTAFSNHAPADRKRIIEDGLKALHHTTSPYIGSYGIDVSQNMMQIGARMIAPPTLAFGERKSVSLTEFTAGSWNMTDKKYFQPSEVPSWALLNFTSRDMSDDKSFAFAQTLMNVMIGRGIRVAGMPKYFRVDGARVEQQLAIFNTQTPPRLIVAILPQNALDIYVKVKQFGDIQSGIVTQCVRFNQRKRLDDQYCNNLCLKINAKLGGVNFTIMPETNDAMKRFKAKPTMVIGADVTHPDTLSKPSIAAMVSSYDFFASQYRASVSLQSGPREETITNIGQMLKAAIEAFQRKNNEILPQRLIFYRDGVSEGEYEKVRKAEMDGMAGALEALYGPKDKRPWPTLMFIVVGKRHHVRFFPDKLSDADKKGHCRPGLVVDKDIVHPSEEDFYMQSQAGLIGTCRPSHYIVLHNDEPDFDANFLQEFSYLLCHVYSRATRSVSIPAPVYYADLVCGRGAKFHWNPAVNYDDHESVNSETGSHRSFNIQFWQENFRGVAGPLQSAMYFV